MSDSADPPSSGPRRASTRDPEPLTAALRRVLDHLPELIWTGQADGQVDFVNRRWCDYTSLSSEQARGVGWRVALHPDDGASLDGFWRTAPASGMGPARACEARLRRADGVFRWFHFRPVPLAAAAGAVGPTWYGLCTEVEDRRQADALVAEEKRLLEMMARGRPLPLILGTLCRHVETALPGRWCSVLLLDTRGETLRHAAGPSLPAGFNAAMQSRPLAVENGPCAQAVVLKQTVVASDLTQDHRWPGWRPLAQAHGLRACWSTPILSGDGDVLGTFALYSARIDAALIPDARTIEQFAHLASIAIERTRAEESLRHSEQHLARAQRLSAIGSFSYHAASNNLRISAETCRICGFDPGAPVAPEAMRDRIHPEDLRLFRTMLDSTDRHHAFDCRLRLPDGSLRHLHVVGDAERDEAGRLLEWVGAIRDVTAARHAEDTLLRMQAELAHVSRVATLGEMMASITHEVNQPLASVIINATTCRDWLTGTPPDLARALAAAERTLRDGQRAGEVISRLRALYTKTAIAKAPLVLNDALTEVLTLVRGEVRRQQIIVKTELGAGLPEVLGDRVQLQQVILNLVRNALDALSKVTGRPRELTLTTRTEGTGFVLVEVQDSGEGLPADAEGRLFESFYTTKPEGMGIGLSISRTIIAHHGGTIRVLRRPAPGATFQFTVPIVPPAGSEKSGR